MKIAIVGTGAIGGYIGACLARSGLAVTAIARGATAAALHSHGWRVDSGGSRFSAPARVETDAAQAGVHDVVIVAVKGPAMAEVAPMIRAMMHADTVVVPAMNGVPWWFGSHVHALGAAPLESVDPQGRILAMLPASSVIGCVVHMAASVSEPGVVRHALGRRLILGEPSGVMTPRLAGIADALRRAQLDVE
ncbi:MAG: 2-dehydropantoate 2-reductase N-terminal domain-containing protein, partial [Casimicrobiaceae bacterium]